jgi:hypothetical protein
LLIFHLNPSVCFAWIQTKPENSGALLFTHHVAILEFEFHLYSFHSSIISPSTMLNSANTCTWDPNNPSDYPLAKILPNLSKGACYSKYYIYHILLLFHHYRIFIYILQAKKRSVFLCTTSFIKVIFVIITYRAIESETVINNITEDYILHAIIPIFIYSL